MKNRVTECLGIEYPVLQGGMAWVSEAVLAASVSNAGGLGIIAGGNMPAELLREEIRNCRALTERPFGVNVMMMSPYVEEVAAMLTEEKVPVIITGAGSPARFLEDWKATGAKIVPVVASTAMARKMEDAGADAVIAEGGEAGGHIGPTHTMALIPQIADAVSIPVIAAGGIADARGVTAAFALGAEGVQVGTRFLVAHECRVHPNYKEAVLKATDISTVVTGRSTGHPVRGLKTRFTRSLLKWEAEGMSPEELEEKGLGSLRRAVLDGDRETGSFMAGQIAGLVCKEESSEAILRDLIDGVPAVLERLNTAFAPEKRRVEKI